MPENLKPRSERAPTTSRKIIEVIRRGLVMIDNLT